MVDKESGRELSKAQLCAIERTKRLARRIQKDGDLCEDILADIKEGDSYGTCADRYSSRICTFIDEYRHTTVANAIGIIARELLTTLEVKQLRTEKCRRSIEGQAQTEKAYEARCAKLGHRSWSGEESAELIRLVHDRNFQHTDGRAAGYPHYRKIAEYFRDELKTEELSTNKLEQHWYRLRDQIYRVQGLKTPKKKLINWEEGGYNDQLLELAAKHKHKEGRQKGKPNFVVISQIMGPGFSRQKCSAQYIKLTKTIA